MKDSQNSGRNAAAPVPAASDRRAAIVRRMELGLALALTAAIVVVHAAVLTHAGPLWRDEINTVHLANLPSVAEVWDRLQYDSFPVLWFLVVRGWTALGPGGSDSGLRILGMLVGVGVVGLLWIAAKRLGRSVPLVSLVLVGLSPPVFRLGDSMRAYGAGILTMLLTLLAVWSVVERLTWRRAAVAAALAILSVHFLYYNAVMLFAVGAGAMAVAVRRRKWRTFLAVAGIGAAAALSLIPYLDTMRRIDSWNIIFKGTVSLDWVLGRLAEAVGLAGDFAVWVWLAAALLAVAACTYRLARPAEDASHGSAESSAESRAGPADSSGRPIHARRARTDSGAGQSDPRDLPLFILVTLLVVGVAYIAFLKFLGYPTQPWYYVTLIALAGVMVDAAVGRLIRGETGRLFRLAAVVVVGLAVSTNVWSQACTRQTNVDLVAAKLESVAAPDDLIIANPWYFGLGMNRYYHGPAPWVTLPPIDDFRTHRYDLYKERMAEVDPIRAVLDRMAATLRGGHRVYLVGGLDFLGPGQAPLVLPPAPESRYGWSEAAYGAAWSAQAAFVLQSHANSFEPVGVPHAGPVNQFENVRLFVFRVQQ